MSAIVSIQTLVLLILFLLLLHHALTAAAHGGVVVCDVMALVAAVLFHNRLFGMENQNDNDPNNDTQNVD